MIVRQPNCCEAASFSGGSLIVVEAATDMEKGADTRTLSAEIFENCRNFLIDD